MTLVRRHDHFTRARFRDLVLKAFPESRFGAFEAHYVPHGDRVLGLQHRSRRGSRGSAQRTGSSPTTSPSPRVDSAASQRRPVPRTDRATTCGAAHASSGKGELPCSRRRWCSSGSPATLARSSGCTTDSIVTTVRSRSRSKAGVEANVLRARRARRSACTSRRPTHPSKRAAGSSRRRRTGGQSACPVVEPLLVHVLPSPPGAESRLRRVRRARARPPTRLAASPPTPADAPQPRAIRRDRTGDRVSTACRAGRRRSGLGGISRESSGTHSPSTPSTSSTPCRRTPQATFHPAAEIDDAARTDELHDDGHDHLARAARELLVVREELSGELVLHHAYADVGGGAAHDVREIGVAGELVRLLAEKERLARTRTVVREPRHLPPAGPR